MTGGDARPVTPLARKGPIGATEIVGHRARQWIDAEAARRHASRDRGGRYRVQVAHARSFAGKEIA
jgi:hypothetical protein